jgi:triosephosphate isomerase (TIM)
MNYFIANWKMNMSIKDIVPWLAEFSKIKLLDSLDRKIIICPSYPHIALLRECNKEMGFEVGAQDLSVFEKGAHTGETGNFQLKELCAYTLVGHSERKEPYDVVLQKINLAKESGITPIVCFVNPDEAKKYNSVGGLLAWEDPNNISVNGVYREKDSKNILNGVKKIKKNTSPSTPLIYGGSVNRENIKLLNEIKEIDGVLVGNASLDPKHFADIINSGI